MVLLILLDELLEAENSEVINFCRIIYFQWWPALSSAVIGFCAIKIGNKSLTPSCAAGKKAALTRQGSGTLK